MIVRAKSAKEIEAVPVGLQAGRSGDKISLLSVRELVRISEEHPGIVSVMAGGSDRRTANMLSELELHHLSRCAISPVPAERKVDERMLKSFKKDVATLEVVGAKEAKVERSSKTGVSGGLGAGLVVEGSHESEKGLKAKVNVEDALEGIEEREWVKRQAELTRKVINSTRVLVVLTSERDDYTKFGNPLEVMAVIATQPWYIQLVNHIIHKEPAPVSLEDVKPAH